MSLIYRVLQNALAQICEVVHIFIAGVGQMSPEGVAKKQQIATKFSLQVMELLTNLHLLAEAMQMYVFAKQTEDVEQQDHSATDQIVAELNDLQLMLIGGGNATVSFN